ncbi:hypothetical protein BOTBODRAFT_407912 [Botryobasidium botryosum FD-172 SS1]|uniref:Uncharacterized protein n=1 Tax=Botryobasidium botryosum (strain FD-172 SS1) TaxID=930990 RepID=A0A067MAU1_BOTB1|nr:hypothetical protein BOTBODRAFT_407912 [Botryobasidium botryosum FD-172 SS1]
MSNEHSEQSVRLCLCRSHMNLQLRSQWELPGRCRSAIQYRSNPGDTGISEEAPLAIYSVH